MEKQYKLTVAIITMNRAQQLKDAVESCVASTLPEKTQFVIVDNGSTDETEAVALELQKTIPYPMIYHKEPVNLGAGGGRNVCYDLSSGEYLFFLDDDAQISGNSRAVFFTKSLSYLDANPKVATLTTNIIDKVFGDRPIGQSKHLRIDGLKCAYTFHEGSVFMRRSAFTPPMYMNIMYGGEGVSVSTRVRDNGFYNVYDPDIYIDHLPKVNKWKSADREFITMQAASNLYVIKKLMYPVIFTPALWAVYHLRIHRYRLQDKSLIGKFRKMNRDFCKANKIKRVKIGCVLHTFKEFGMTTF